MKATQIELELENGEKVTCTMAGNGPNIGYIAGGPGSFYLQGLSVLENLYTFVTYDTTWTYHKFNSDNSNYPKFTKEMIKCYDHLIVNALKKYFNISDIDGFGFSAPGAFLFEEALEHPNDYRNIIGTGIGLIELDPTFAKTNEIFFTQADLERKNKFTEYQNKYKEFTSIISNNKKNDSLFSFFGLKATTKLPLKPHKIFIAETIAMMPKLLFDYSDAEKTKEIIINHWKHNPFGLHIDKRTQEHFFNEIYRSLTPLMTLLNLAATNKKITLIYGDQDYITPLTDNILNTLRLYPNVHIEKLNSCAHLPYMESPEQYANIINSHLTTNDSSLNINAKL